MSIYKFKSKAYGDVVMLPDHAKKLFEIAGHSLPEQGAIEPAAMPEIRARLVAAINSEKLAELELKDNKEEAPELADEALKPEVSMEQRAYPFLKMLEASEKAQTSIHWGF